MWSYRVITEPLHPVLNHVAQCCIYKHAQQSDALGLYLAELPHSYWFIFCTCAWHEPLSTVWDVLFFWFLLCSLICPAVSDSCLYFIPLKNNKAYLTVLPSCLLLWPATCVMHFVTQPVEGSNKCHYYQVNSEINARLRMLDKFKHKSIVRKIYNENALYEG